MTVEKYKKIFEIYSKIMKMRYLGGSFDKKVAKPKVVIDESHIDKLARAIGTGDFTTEYRNAIYKMFEVHLGKKIPRKAPEVEMPGLFLKLPSEVHNGYTPGSLWVITGNENSHNYKQGVVVMCCGRDYGLQLGASFSFGNHMPDMRDDDDEADTVRAATKPEIVAFIKAFDVLASKLTAAQIAKFSKFTNGITDMERISLMVSK